jgi:diacylglycerol kinase (ATP)
MSQIDGEFVVIQRNPTAGAGTSRRILLNLVRELRKQPFHVRMFSDRDQLDAFVTSDQISSRIRCLVAAGGDGTVADLVNRHPKHPITVLPMGTENLIARHLNIPRDGSVVADTIQQGHVQTFDTAQAGNRQYLLMASAGIDADVVHRLHATRSGNIRHWTYIRPILQTFASYQFPEITVTDVQTEKTVTGSHVIVSNFKEYGFNLKLTPDADPIDGWLDVCVFQGRSVTQSAIHAIKCLFRPQNGPLVVRFRSRHVSLSASDKHHSEATNIPLETDGDPAGHLPVAIRINEATMRLLVRRPELQAADSCSTERPDH